jgi:hypothetical protein
MAKRDKRLDDTDFDPEQFSAIVTSAEIKLIRLKETVAHLGDFRELNGQVQLPDNVNHTVTVEVHRPPNENQIASRFVLAVRGAYQDQDAEQMPEEKLPLFIKALFEIHYKFGSDDQLDDHHLAAFGHNVGIQNVWPYWREYVQSTTTRMGLPGMMVPLVRFGSPQSLPKKVPKRRK